MSKTKSFLGIRSKEQIPVDTIENINSSANTLKTFFLTKNFMKNTKTTLIGKINLIGSLKKRHEIKMIE
jgi:hypothetical protein